MPRGRMLNRKISIDEDLENLSDKAIILFTWCISHLDVEGKILADAHILKGTVVPYLTRFTNSVIKKCVDEIGQLPNVVLYGNGHKYLKFLKFDDNQNINKDREAESEIPDPTPEELQSKSRVTPAKVKLSKDKISKGANAHLSNEEFLQILKTNPAYKGIDIDSELAKMDAWLLARPNREKTERFIVNWLNKSDRVVETPVHTKRARPTCDVCGGTGKILEGEHRGAQCFCVS